MSSIELERVCFAYRDSVPLFTDLSLRLLEGWYGVVGPNGSGKTTLLGLIAGEIRPDRGALRSHPPGLDVRICPQRVESLSPEILELSDSASRRARRLIGQLRLDPLGLSRWPTLSAGERKRWQVAAALAASPSAILLDEPTNHLDTEARDLLLAALERFRGVGLLVSHDRTLLNRLASHTVRLHAGGVRLFRGAYDAARETWEREEREKVDAYERLRGEQRRLERRLCDRRSQRARAEGRMSTRRRMKSLRDSDARARFKASRRRSAEVSLGREIGKVHGRLERLAERASELRFEKIPGRSLFVDWVPASVPILSELSGPTVRAGETTLIERVEVSLRRESRIWLRGPNGAGKSTLLASLVGAARVPRSRLLYLPQELRAEEEAEILASLRDLDPGTRGRVLSIVAALGVAPDRLLESGAPSPGEARKISLATGLARQVWGLVLDEPTNHLDLPSIERLEEMLASYPGALLLVTHDDRLAHRCATVCWDISGRQLLVRSTEQGRVEDA